MSSQTFVAPRPVPGAGLSFYANALRRPHAPRRLTHSNRRSFTDALDRLRSVRSTQPIYLGEAN
jgi:hypothetical protein